MDAMRVGVKGKMALLAHRCNSEIRETSMVNQTGYGCTCKTTASIALVPSATCAAKLRCHPQAQ